MSILVALIVALLLIFFWRAALAVLAVLILAIILLGMASLFRVGSTSGAPDAPANVMALGNLANGPAPHSHQPPA
jgi:Cu/Ag efflux pump CusA